MPGYLPDGLWVMEADGSNPTRLLEEDDPAIGVGYASWSPDGRLIAYSRFQTPDLDETRADAEIWTVAADGTNAHRVVDGAGMQWIPRVSPDGGSVAYTQEEVGGPWANAGPVGPGPGVGPGGGVPVNPLSVPLSNADLWQVSTTGTGSPRQLSDNAADDRAPVYSPDGSKIIFDSTRDGNTEIYALDLETDAERRLTVEPGEDWGATWSPDGTHIAFNSDRDGPMDIYVMASDGSGVRRVTFTTVPDSGNIAPSWSPDGSRIAYTARTGNEPSEIWSVRSTGGDARNLSRSQIAADEMWTGGWGPDGRIVFSRALPSPPRNGPLAREDLGAASMLLSASLLAIVVVAVVRAGWSFGSFTLVLSLAIALVVTAVEAWRFLILGPVIGLAVDVALYRSAPRHWSQVAGATAAAALVLASGLVILATSQLGWSPTLLLGVASAAGVIGWGVGAIGSGEGRSNRTTAA
jgi:dipeptidyl aminopeptidase/acylaminoacyl peptidase